MRRRRTKVNETSGGVPEYMLTYGDMMTLLLCFFILLFAFSEIDAQKFQAIMRSFQGSAGVLRDGKSLLEDNLIFEASSNKETTTTNTDIEDFRALKKIVQEYIEINNLKNEIMVELENRGLLLRFNDNVLFDSGKAVLKPESLETLWFLSELLDSEEFRNKDIRI